MTERTAGYQALAQAVLDQSKIALLSGDGNEWDFYASGHYQLFTGICDINDDVFRQKITDIALPRVKELKVKVSDIILFYGGFYGN